MPRLPAADPRRQAEWGGDRYRRQGVELGPDRVRGRARAAAARRRRQLAWFRSRVTPIPQNSSATALLALLLDAADRSDEALALLAAVPQDDPLISQVRDVQVRILTDDKRFNDAYAIAAAAAEASGGRDRRLFAARRRSEVDGPTRRGGRCVRPRRRDCQRAGSKDELWSLLLLQANALEEANRWPEAKAALQQALAFARTSRCS